MMFAVVQVFEMGQAVAVTHTGFGGRQARLCR